jgi:hypothetical protein
MPVQNIFLLVATHTTFDIVKANQNTCSTLLLEENFFFVSLYIGVEVPCLPIPTLELHKVQVLVCIAQYHRAEIWWHHEIGSQSPTSMCYVPHHALKN